LGYQGVDKRAKAQAVKATWHIATRPSKRRALNKDSALGELLEDVSASRLAFV
jgi:IS5 family transposase